MENYFPSNQPNNYQNVSVMSLQGQNDRFPIISKKDTSYKQKQK